MKSTKTFEFTVNGGEVANDRALTVQSTDLALHRQGSLCDRY